VTVQGNKPFALKNIYKLQLKITQIKSTTPFLFIF